MITLERAGKGLAFGCRMCGNCLLQETAFICPMECPKGLRNGPCGGSTPEHCYVDETRPCIWYRIYERAEKMGRLDRLMEVLPPLDWDKIGTSAVKDVFTHLQEIGGVKTVWNGCYGNRRKAPAGLGPLLLRDSPARLVGRAMPCPTPLRSTIPSRIWKKSCSQRQICRHR